MNEILSQIIFWWLFVVGVILFGIYIYWMIWERQITKAEYYGKSNPNYHRRTNRLQLPEILGRKKEKETSLTEAESACRKLLSELQGKTVWHYSIRHALHQGRNEDFRELIRQIKSEGVLVPHVMKNILGEECYRVVMDLEDAS